MSAARRRDKISRGWGDDLPTIPVSKIDAELYGALREVEGDRATLLGNQIHIGSFVLTSTGLQIDNSATQDEWSKIGEILFRLEGSIQWLIGDWLAYGANFGYGDVKKLAIEMGREPGTFWEYAYVCRSVESWVRTQDLSYGHHKLVAPYTPEEQQYYLQYATQGEEKPLSVARFRAWIKEQRGDVNLPALPAEHQYDVAKLTYSVYGVAQKDLMRVPVREIHAALDNIRIIEQQNAQIKAQLLEALSKREKH